METNNWTGRKEEGTSRTQIGCEAERRNRERSREMELWLKKKVEGRDERVRDK